VVLILFGRGRISEFMGDFGKGIKSFKQGMADENESKPAPPPAQIAPAPVEPAPEVEKAPEAANSSKSH
jgi:sec-independent protein translocase protein TatA